MRLLADAPAAARGFAPPGAAWEVVQPGALDPALARTWRLLAGDAAPWRPGERAARADPTARTLLVLDHAAGSQFESLRAALRRADDLPPSLASLALTGSGFRGQRSRTWEALRGNLHLCVLARLDRPAGPLQAALTALPAVATARAVERVTGDIVRPGLKWVNDLLVAGRKIGGVLTATQVQGGRVTHALFGIGVNVARTPELPADPRVARPGCLADSEPRLRDALPELTAIILEEVDAGIATLLDGHAAEVVDAYRRRSMFLGRRVAIWPVSDDDRMAHEPVARGRVVGLLDDLGLRLEGRTEPVRSGRMTLLDDEADGDDEDA